jgi:hypothetical protein
MGGYSSLTEQPTNFTATTPAAPGGAVNVVPQADAPTPPPTSVVRNFSAYVPPMTSSNPGAVPTPPNDPTKFLDGTGHWTKPSGGGGSGNQNISYYLSPTSIIPPEISSPAGLNWAYRVNATYAFNDNGALVITTFSSGGTPEILGELTPVGNYDAIGCFGANPSLISGQTTIFGIALWDSGSGKVVSFELNMSQGTVPQLVLAHLSSFTTFVTSPYAINNYLGLGQPIWLRINCSSGKYTFYVSVDGQSWDQAYQESTTAYMPAAADHVGIEYYNKASTPANVVIPHLFVG